MAYKYASKMRRLMLANRISQLAMDMQEKEEEEATADPDARTDVESSADLFDTQLDLGGTEEQEETNPILAARSKKQGCDHVLIARGPTLSFNVIYSFKVLSNHQMSFIVI